MQMVPAFWPLGGSGNPLNNRRIGEDGRAVVGYLEESTGDVIRRRVTARVLHGQPPFLQRRDQRPEADAVPLTSLVAFLNTIDPPSSTACRPSVGNTVFTSVGCATCHTPSLPANGNATAAFLYSDLLLHDMGASLADDFEQGSARGSEFRTAPLWRVADRSHFLHDGRATSIEDAIRAHDGQGAGARDRYKALPAGEAQALLDFLRCI